MENKIKKLKDLRLAYECAINYDHVPEKDEAQHLITYMFPEHLSVDIKNVERVLEEYEGNSPGNIVNLILDVIDEL